MPRVLLIAATTGYQLRSFTAAADRVGVELVLATDRCDVLDDPWNDRAIPVRFHDETGAVHAIKEGLADRPVTGVVAVGDRPALIGALAAEALWLPGNAPDAVRVAGNKLLTRARLREADLPCPWFTAVPPHERASSVAGRVTFPCVVKPLAMSASRGVMRANSAEELDEAIHRARSLLRLPDVAALRDPANLTILVEEYLPGHEVAIEGVMTEGQLHTLAVFDKPDPLEGPFFEETIYVTAACDSARPDGRVCRAVAGAAVAIGLTHGPVHAECRVTHDEVFVLEVAARPIGGLCSKALRFTAGHGDELSLEELLLRHAKGERVSDYQREPRSSGVMMMPIPHDGRYKGVVGVEQARGVAAVEEVIVTAKRDQRVRPLPEGGSYLGFIFARADRPTDVVSSLRDAYGCLTFEIAPPIPMA